MDDYKISPLNLAQMYEKTFASSIVDSSFRVDEGYAEEARSQDDIDSTMRLDIAISASMVANVPEGIMALNEAERSGMSLFTTLIWLFDRSPIDDPRFCVQYSADFENLFYRCDC